MFWWFVSHVSDLQSRSGFTFREKTGFFRPSDSTRRESGIFPRAAARGIVGMDLWRVTDLLQRFHSVVSHPHLPYCLVVLSYDGLKTIFENGMVRLLSFQPSMSRRRMHCLIGIKGTL